MERKNNIQEEAEMVSRKIQEEMKDLVFKKKLARKLVD